MKKTKPTGHRWPARIAAGCARFVSTLSILLLAAFLGLQLFVCWRGSLPAPNLLQERIREEFAGQGLGIEYASIRLLTPDRLAVTSLRLESTNHPGLAIEADRVMLRFSPRSLLRDEIPLRAARMDGVRLTCPPSLSHSGDAEVLVRDLYLRTSGDNRTWAIDELILRSGDVTASLRGALPVFPKKPSPDLLEPRWEANLANAARSLSRVKASLLDGIDDGSLRVVLDRRLFNRLAVDARLSLRTFRHPSGALLERAEIDAGFLLDESRVDGSVRLRAAAAAYGGDGRAESLVARGTLPQDPLAGDLVPDDVRAAAARLSVLGEEAGNLFLTGTKTGGDRVELAAYAAIDGRPVRGTGELDWRTGEGRLEAHADVNPSGILRGDAVRSTGFDFDVRFETAPEVDATLAFGPNWTPQQADIELRSGPCVIDGVALDSAIAAARWTPGIFDVPEMLLRRDDFRVTGSYWTDMETLDYRTSYAGTVRPSHLAPWFEDWWKALWEPFQFPEAPPTAEIEIEGRWRDLDRLRLSGWMKGEKLRFRGVDLDTVSAGYSVVSATTRVSEARISGPDGRAEGELVFRHGDPNSVEFEVTSNMDTNTALRLVGGETGDLLSAFAFDSPPEILLSGRLVDPEARGPHPEDRLAFRAQSDTPLAFQGIPLDRLSLEGRMEEQVLSLDSIEAGFAGGDVSGSIQLDPNGGNGALGFAVSIRDAAFGPGLEHLANRADNEASAERLEELRNLGGRADFDLEAEGRLDDHLSFEGNGSVHVRDAELGRIRLLGLLSRLLDQTPLRFTSLQLNEAETSFHWRQDRIHFPDLEMRGPNVGIEAQGDYHLPNQALDFRVNLFPLRESSVPLVSTILGRILEPFGYMLEMSLSGTLDEPLWRLPFDPRRTFDQAPEAIEPP